jgi:phosphopantothenoylcysteine decarboxylase / phosphopantothenate---cysteine ligase
MNLMKMLSEKNIILGVSGGIAAYKSVELLRLLQKAGAAVKVAMTANAAQFVGPLTFAAISGHKVFKDMFSGETDEPMWHISWADAADAMVIAPATANIIAKLANGIADDALTTLMLAATCPKLICPAMNIHMYENIAVQRNIDILQSDGFIVVEPGDGELACGAYGPGRMAEPQTIAGEVAACFYPKDFAGKKVLVTAGPTRESIDPVRFISNPSSGKMGYALARAAAARGADVVLVSGPSSLDVPVGAQIIRVVTAAEMASAVFENAGHADIVIKVAAVSDYRPVAPAEHKIKKSQDKMLIELEKTVDILAELGRRKRPGQVLVGFAAETRDLEINAVNKLCAKNLDLIAANVVGDANAGFEADSNRITLYDAVGRREELPLMDKDVAAHHLLDRVRELSGR